MADPVDFLVKKLPYDLSSQGSLKKMEFKHAKGV